MQPMDGERERQVWQRVAAAQAAEQGDQAIGELLRLSAEGTAAYRDLAGSASGKNRERYQKLRDIQKHITGVLRGILVYQGIGAPTGVYPGSGEPAVRALHRILRRGRELYIGLASRGADSELGMVYSHLAQLQGEQMAETLELLGAVSQGK